MINRKLQLLGLGAFALLPALAALPGTSAAQNQQPRASYAMLTPAQIDHEIRLAWKQNGIIPAPPVDDARYLRRIYLDIAGIIPGESTVKAFLADRDSDKRAKAVSKLLDDPRYVENWTNYWENALMGSTARAATLDRVAFRQWLHDEFAQNTPYNKFVTDLITATGQNSTGGSYAKVVGLETMADKPIKPMTVGRDAPLGNVTDKTAAATDRIMTKKNASDQAMTGTAMQGDAMMMQGGNGAGNDAAPVNGAVNWFMKYQGKPEDLSGTTSKIFLGVQIQCAQCHDHKTEKWKQDDFRRFTACFMNTRPRPVDTGKIKGLRRVELVDIRRPFVPRRGKKAGNGAEYAQAQPMALDGTDFSDSPNRRQALAAWMTADNNPWFAEAIVNRMWSHFLGRGFVEPIDDFRPSNPANMPGLMRALGDDFKAHSYDLKHLIKTICATQAYQLSSGKAVKGDPANTYWERYRLTPMNSDELLDSLVTATNLQPVLESVAGNRLDALKFAMKKQFTFLFDVDEEFEQKDFEGTIPAALLLLNGGITNRGVTPIPGTTLSDVMALPTDAERIEALYLRTLSRRPSASELSKWTTWVNQPRDVITNADNTPGNSLSDRRALRMMTRMNQNKPKGGGGADPLAPLARRFRQPAAAITPKQQAYEDLFWALLNSSEFMFNH